MDTLWTIFAIVPPEAVTVGGTVGGAAVITFALNQLWKMNGTLAEIATLMKSRTFCPMTDNHQTK